MHPLWLEAIAEGRCDQRHADLYHDRSPIEELICDTCGKLIVPNVEACYGAADPGPRHYDCTSFRKSGHTSALEASRAAVGELGDKMKKFEGLLQDFKRETTPRQKFGSLDEELQRRGKIDPRFGPK